jgi:nicotinate phosphoribosyltransferase
MRDEVDPSGSRLGLFTDLYELKMLESYLRLGMCQSATFSLIVRPSEERPWLVAAGLDLALDVLDRFAYGTPELEYAKALGLSNRALDWLRSFRLSGELWAVQPGTVVLGGSPLLELTAPLPVGQLLETALLNAIHYDTLIATKAARCALAARERPVFDFGFRRAPGLETGVRAALAAYIGGVSASSNVEAGRRFGVPLAGTMAHSFVQAFCDEGDAFDQFLLDHPDGTTLLVDTYDTARGVDRAIQVIRRHAAGSVRALRLDSEPLLELARLARARLDAAGLQHIRLIASGGLDEARIAQLLDAGAPIDGFGIGSALVCSSDAPALDAAYKLVEYDGRSCAKYSGGKLVLPGPKQVFRTAGPDSDVLERRGARSAGDPLLSPVWRDRARLWHFDLASARARAQRELSQLPGPWRRPWQRTPGVAVRVGPELLGHAAETARRLGAGSPIAGR